MRPRQNSIISVRIEGLRSDGRGYGRAEDTVFVAPGVFPGDIATLRTGRTRGGDVDSRVVRVEDAGVVRFPAVCSHFGVCGGCPWQELGYPDQVRFKSEMVRNALETLNESIPLEEPIPADLPFFYRNKMEFSFGQVGGELVVGLHVRGKFDRVFDLDRCHLQSEASNRIVAAVRDYSIAAGLPPYDLKRHQGLLRFLTVREGKGTGEVMVNLVTSEEPFEPRDGMLQAILAAAPEVVTVIHTVNRRKAQVATGDASNVLWGGGFIRERLAEFTFRISPNSFFQTNPRQAERLYELVFDYAEPSAGENALDLYCGTGAIAAFLARRAGRVIGVESSQEAVRDALRNCAENAVAGCQFVGGDAGSVLGQLRRQGEKFEVAVVDPPRSGMHPEAARELITLAPGRIVYVSCNPESLATDLARLLAAGYRVERGRVVDLFPQTPHCETVVKLART